MGPNTQHKLVLCLFGAYIWYQLQFRRPTETLLLERFEALLIVITLSQLTTEELIEKVRDCVNTFRTINRYFNLFSWQSKDE